MTIILNFTVWSAEKRLYNFASFNRSNVTVARLCQWHINTVGKTQVKSSNKWFKLWYRNFTIIRDKTIIIIPAFWSVSIFWGREASSATVWTNVVLDFWYCSKTENIGLLSKYITFLCHNIDNNLQLETVIYLVKLVLYSFYSRWFFYRKYLTKSIQNLKSICCFSCY